MSEEEAEETTGTQVRGRPNAWFAEQGGGYGSGYRGVPGPGRPKAEALLETVGDIDTCWCGLPADHEWAGKSEGRKHPRKVDEVTAVKAETETEKPMLRRKDVTGFHLDLQDLMMVAVNEFGCRFRLNGGRNGGILLYAPDGSPPMRVAPRKNTDFLPQLRRWFIAHVSHDETRAKEALRKFVSDPQKVLAANEVAAEDAARKLAVALNSPEHPVPEKPAQAPAPNPAQVAQRVQPVRVSKQPEIQVLETEWEPYIDSRGQSNEKFEQREVNGVWWYRCKACVGTDAAYETDHPRGLGGHWRTRHVDDDFWGKETNEKRVEGRQLNRLRADVQAGLELIANAVGMESGDKVKALEKQVEEYRKKYMETLADLTDAETERDEYKAKIEIMREAMGL